MIKSAFQCREVQKRRVAAGKPGYAHAVRRYINRTDRARLVDLPVIQRYSVDYRETP